MIMAGTNNKDPIQEASRFEGQGINFRAKLIGVEDVAEARGDKMCQESIQRLKAIKKASKEHKQRIIVNVSLTGLKILDQASANVDHTHEVHRISFISRDVTDARAFGYIYGPGDGSHKFFGIKTEKAAEHLVLSLRDLFQVVYDIKKREVEEAKKEKEQKEATTIELKDAVVGESDDSVYQVPQNGAPVEGTESEYAGIEQMSTFESLFEADLNPTVSSSSTTGFNDAWSTPATPVTGQTTTTSSTIPGFPLTSTQQPFGLPPSNVSMPGTPFPISSQATPFQPVPTAGFPTNTSGGFGVPAASPSPSPFGLPPPPSAAVKPTFNQPTSIQAAPRLSGLPVASDPFGSDPFTTNTGNQGMVFNAPAGNPFGAPSGGASLFPPSSEPSSNMSGWPNEQADILAPVKIVGEDELDKAVPSNPVNDPFGDLCDIGTFTNTKKSPKEMFKEMSAPPKKTLNELKANVPAQPPSPQPPFGGAAAPAFGAADPFGFGVATAPVNPNAQTNSPFGNVPLIPTTQQASDAKLPDPFGPLDKLVNKIPDLASAASDPFDTSSIMHISPTSNRTAVITNTPAPKPSDARPRPKAKKPVNIHKDNANSVSNYVTSDGDFNLPSPDEPPPPLPPDALALFQNAPKPPPRPPSVNSKPLPVTRSASIKASKSESQSLGSEDAQNHRSNQSSIDASPVPYAKPRRKSSDISNNLPEVIGTMLSLHNATSASDSSHNTPVPKPRKSLSKNSSFSSEHNGITFDSDPFPTIDFPDPFNLSLDSNQRDHNDNDPFLSSQHSKNQVDFDSKWDAVSSDKTNTFSDAFTNDKFDAFTNNFESSSNNPAPFGDPF